MSRVPGKPWFAPKQYGYGFSFPIAWQGWAMTAAVVAGVIAARFLLTGAWQVIAYVALFAVFVVIGTLKTEGGWRWRWGGDPE